MSDASSSPSPDDAEQQPADTAAAGLSSDEGEASECSPDGVADSEGGGRSGADGVSDVADPPACSSAAGGAATSDGSSARSGVGRVQFAPRPSPEQRRLSRRRRRRRRRIVGFSLLGAGVLVLVFLAWVGFQCYRAYDNLQSAGGLLAEAEAQVHHPSSIDASKITALADDLQDHSSAALSAVQDPMYRLASHIPWVGPNLAAVSAVATTVDDISTQVVPAVVDVADLLRSGLAPKDGQFDLASIKRAAGPLEAADRAVNAGRARMAAIDRTSVIGPIDRAIVEMWDKLDRAAELTATGARIGRLLPEMLGAAAPRRYLVIFQNPAELRATGGIFGSYVLVSADHGRISIVDQGATSRSIGTFTTPVEADPALRRLYSDRLVTSPLDVNFTADFATAAHLYSAMYTERTGTQVDGVIALDPVAVSYLLEGQPAIRLPGGVALSAGNIVPFLLSSIYAKYPETADATERDEYLASAVQAVFASIVHGNVSSQQMLKGLQRAASERRLLIWSRHSDEESDLSDTQLAGRLDDSESDPPTVGVYFNDGTGAKLGYYLNGSVQVRPQGCNSSGARILDVRVQMNYSAPASGLPDYVIGLALGGKPYVLRTNVVIMAPAGGAILAMTNGGRAVPKALGTDHGLATAIITVDLSPGASTTVEAKVTAPTAPEDAGSAVTPSIRVTPGVHTWNTQTASYAGCRATQ